LTRNVLPVGALSVTWPDVALYRPIGRVGWRLITKGSILVFVRIEHTRRVKAGRRTNPGRENQRQGQASGAGLFSWRRFTFGSAYELPSQDGAELAHHHDAVSVTVNHRLNILGFFDVSEIGGSVYADSANVGTTDLVASLKWIRENIANFGGDPDSVMIYGQSGGGSKVTCLMGMPSAAGLFHRASVQSGGGGNIPGADLSRELAKQIMKELGLQPNDLASLQKMDWARLNAAGNAAVAKINPAVQGAAGPGGPPTATPRAGFAPTMDGRTVTLRSFYDVAPDISKNVPMLIGNVSEEGNSMFSRPTEAEWHATLARTWGDSKATALIAAVHALPISCCHGQG
jgi:para-nitrobenzyl esterase